MSLPYMTVIISCDITSQCNCINLLVRWINDVDSVILKISTYLSFIRYIINYI